MTQLSDDELNKLAEQLWKRMEPFARVELERLFTNYMATRTLLEPDLAKKLFQAMEDDLNKFVMTKLAEVRWDEHLRRMKVFQDLERMRKLKEPYW